MKTEKNSGMRQVKKITLSAVMCALGVALMTLGAVFSSLDLTMAAVASLTVVFVYLEIGAPYTWFCWLITSGLSALMFPGSILWAEYLLIFGLYPILKGIIEKTPRPFWWLLKLAFFHVAGALFLVVLRFVYGMPIFGTGTDSFVDISFLADNRTLAIVILYVVALLALIVYDFFLTVVVRIYVLKYRRKFGKFLK